ncbi:ABC transporter permease [Bosea caraganae]|uniref:ABC transporter permease n=1 Tax=Bosea caraganae TaxID=2763117 RepID=A0A370L7P2_9HYPH|nr:ABC transporter permease [Bosea caraganae]RDJ24955.1 ABC transporter permease [Bosea caraganae]RDJ26066.1 ABC transporter permease [Bosea caraganae]
MLDSLLRILALIRKELLAILKDPRSRISLIGPPVIQCLVFGYAATYDLNNVSYALLDHDRSSASRALISRLDGSGVFTRVGTLEVERQIAEFIDDQRALLVITIPQDFERGLQASATPAVQVIADGRNSNTAGTAQGYVSQIVTSFGAEWQAAHGLPGPPVQITTRAWYNPSLETRWYMIPALVGTITMMMTMMLTAMSVAREREEGTFDQLLVTPFRPSEIMVGKAVPAMMVGLIQATMILLVAQLWFRIPFAGSYLILYCGLVLFLAASVGIGLFISSIAGTMQQAMIGSFVLLMPFMLLSGLTSPIGNMPQVLQYFTFINPLRYAISITHQVYLEGAGFGQLLPEMLALVAIAAVTLPIAAWMFRNRLG